MTQPSADQIAVDLANVQGNSLGGFLKDHQVLVFLEFGDDLAAVRNWLTALTPGLATAADVTAFNALYSTLQARVTPPPITATWVNLALTPAGIGKLSADLSAFPAEFTADITQRAVSSLNDPPATNWIAGLQNPAGIDAVLIVDADEVDALNATLDDLAIDLDDGCIREVHREHGDARADDPGHEHFGYKDGVSQPDVNVGPPPYTATDDPWRFLVDANVPPTPPPPGPGEPGYDPNPPPPPPAPVGLPAWTHEGSFAVYRRLRQDVAGFQAWVESQPDGFDDRLIGRQDDGVPLDPAGAAASNNDWTFSDDATGADTPLAAHIRKTNPRSGIEVDHRLLRRGIAYGLSYREGSDPNSPVGANADRGLQFLCYQASIANQFEFVQTAWANNNDFPQQAAGVDPILGQVADETSCPFVGTPDAAPVEVPRFVTTTGVLYLFQPSITGLNHLASTH